MKTTLTLTLLFAGVLAYSQNVSDYRYIRFPEKFSDFENNKFGVVSTLKSQLAKKNYVVVEAGAQLPVDACQMLTADVKNTSNMLRNKVDLVFTDCQNGVVATYKATSLEKDFESGYRDAVTKATAQLAFSQPKNIETMAAAQPTTISNAEPIISANTSVAATTPETSGTAEVYAGPSFNLQRVTMSANQFILVNPNNSQAYAVFNQSGKSGIYHVKLQDGAQGIGYFDNGKIIIEHEAGGRINRQELPRK